MDAPEPIQQRGIERLHAHGDAVDTIRAQQSGFVQRDGGRVALDRPFGGSQQPEPRHGLEDLPPLAQVQQGRGAAAEINRFGLQVCRYQLEFMDQRPDVAAGHPARGRLGVEGAITALARAERHMHVETANRPVRVEHSRA